MISWHSLNKTEIFKELNSGELGLTSSEAKKRLAKHGPNSLPKEKGLSVLQIIFNQVKSPLVYILIIAVIVSFLLDEKTDAIFILIIVVINSIIGFVQENKANNAITHLRNLVEQNATVMRDGQKIIIKSSELVIGDVIVLETGMKIPADSRLFFVNDLHTSEASLTGESNLIKKEITKIAEGENLADRKNMVYMGTSISKGKGLAIICATGIKTEIGKITNLIKKTPEEKTPLQNKISKLARFIAFAVVGVMIVLFSAGIISGRDPVEVFLISVAVAVAAIPEGLVIALTVILVIGMQKILKRKALIRRLIAAETLGSTTVICTDKTGTLTEGKMSVESVFTLKNNPDDIHTCLQIGMLCNDAFMTSTAKDLEKQELVGDPIEIAIIESGTSANINHKDLTNKFKRLDEIPFSSESKFMATLNKNWLNENSILIKGAPELLLSRSKLSTLEKEKFHKKIEELSKQGLRLLGVAYKKVGKEEKIKEKDLENLNFAGIFVFKDPLRSDTKETIKLCKEAGIRPVIITGDHKLTAQAIANEIGIKADKENVMEGKELDKLNEKEFAKLIKKINVYARVEPKHKIRIVEEFKRQGEVVAMAGDGINDAPAIKAADIGIALGSGTDVTKETADMVLLNNAFSTIVHAVRGGRVIFDNIRKVILYLLTSSFSEIILIGGAIVLGLPLPVLAVQILWVNIVEDALPSFALAADPEEKGIMKDKPRGRKTALINNEMKAIIFGFGIFKDIILLGLFYWFYKIGYDINYIRTFIFAALAFDSVFFIFAVRSIKYPIWRYNPFANHYINFSVLFSLVLMIGAMYVPILQTFLKTMPLHQASWIILIIYGLFNLIFIEFIKAIFEHKRDYVK